eukprot:364850-Chlamydomonas_euryale.AAC.5
MTTQRGQINIGGANDGANAGGGASGQGLRTGHATGGKVAVRGVVGGGGDGDGRDSGSNRLCGDGGSDGDGDGATCGGGGNQGSTSCGPKKYDVKPPSSCRDIGRSKRVRAGTRRVGCCTSQGTRGRIDRCSWTTAAALASCQSPARAARGHENRCRSGARARRQSSPCIRSSGPTCCSHVGEAVAGSRRNVSRTHACRMQRGLLPLNPATQVQRASGCPDWEQRAT